MVLQHLSLFNASVEPLTFLVYGGEAGVVGPALLGVQGARLHQLQLPVDTNKCFVSNVNSMYKLYKNFN